jgi:hypothetical protein
MSQASLLKNNKCNVTCVTAVPSIFSFTLYLTLREEHRLRVSENSFLRRTFGPKRGEVTGEWGKLNSEELHILNLSPNIITQIKSR